MEETEKLGWKNIGFAVGLLPLWWQLDVERSGSDVRLWIGPFYIAIGLYDR